MPLKHKIGVPKKCEFCSTEDITKFSPCIYNICQECKRVRSNKVYFCKTCSETDISNFYEGRFSTCKKCRLRTAEEKSVMDKTEDLPENKNIRDYIDKYLMHDYRLFKGLTLVQFFNEIREAFDNLENNEFSRIKNEHIDFKIELHKINDTHFDNFRFFAQKISNELAEYKIESQNKISKLERENEELREKLRSLFPEHF